MNGNLFKVAAPSTGGFICGTVEDQRVSSCINELPDLGVKYSRLPSKDSDLKAALLK